MYVKDWSEGDPIPVPEPPTCLVLWLYSFSGIDRHVYFRIDGHGQV